MNRTYRLLRHRYLPAHWLTLTILIFISGCTLQPVEPERDSPHYTHKNSVPQNLPDLELTGELLFDILVAEFAEDSGNLAVANNKYLSSAYTTRDPRLAKRATQVAIFAKDYVAALAGAQLWVELEPESSDARQSNASLLLLQGQLEQAKPHLIWLLEQDSYSGQRLESLTKLMASAPKDKDAELFPFFEGLTPPPPVTTQWREDILYSTALLAQKRGSNSIVLNRLEQLLKLNPDHGKGVQLRAKLWFVGERAADATKSLAEFLQRNPKAFSVRLDYARMLIEARALDEALAQFKELVQQAPRNGDVIYGYGLLAIQSDKLDIAEEQFQNLIHLKVRNAQARQSMGQLFELRHQPDEAISWYRTVPKGQLFFASQLRAAQLIANRDGIEAAQSFLHQIPVEERAEELQIMVTEAELLQLNNQYEEAFKLFSIALKEAPD
ncbi:MAG: tetratricopeptide repeat protein, partial [Gammaproteobacteria bacterium]|nr:tetratricopeptide repeat protein [Gammaproteobacteria bacterium]